MINIFFSIQKDLPSTEKFNYTSTNMLLSFKETSHITIIVGWKFLFAFYAERLNIYILNKEITHTQNTTTKTLRTNI